MGLVTGVTTDGLTLQGDWRAFFTHTLYQQHRADTHFADTCSDFALLSVIYGVMDKNIKRCPPRPPLGPVILAGKKEIAWIGLTSILLRNRM